MRSAHEAAPDVVRRDETGLTTARAVQALEVDGPNEIPQPEPPRLISRIAAQLRDPMLLLLLVAGAVTTSIRDYTDTGIIAAVVVLNTALGVLQERRAERAIQALHQLAAPWAVVVRDGRPSRVHAAEVVVGDLMVLQAGDVVPADGLLVGEPTLQVDESAMTGESMPRSRGAGDAVEAGTVVTRGRGQAVVTHTGAASGLGRIAALVAAAPLRATPLQRRLTRLSGQMVVVVLALAAVVMLIGVAQGRSFTEMVVVALSLSVAAVPESLPAVVAIALALGAHHMAQRQAVVRRLPAVETLGSVTVLASDKTGTLTEGRMSVERLWTPAGGDTTYGRHGVLPPGGDELVRALVLCNDAHAVRDTEGAGSLVGDPLEQAMLRLASEHGMDVADLRAEWPRVAERPFEAVTRRMVTVHRQRAVPQVGQHWLAVCKGAPEVVLASSAPGAATDRAKALADTWARDGLRVLVVTAVESAEPLTADPGTHAAGRVLGLVALSDPLRASGPAVAEALRAAGIRMVLVTGDHAATARSVAVRLGMLESSPDVVEGQDLAQRLADDDVRRVGVFARIRPEQKVDIVRSLQASGEVVAMTGDGVNDAPALRGADIGVAMGGSGTEVARQAAALVLGDDELHTVVAAVEEGRRIYDNIRTFLRYGLAGGLAEVLVMLVGPFAGLAIPLVPAQILWINMLTHGLPGVAFGTQPVDPDAMRRPPRSPQESILGAGLTRQIAVSGSLIALVSLLAGGFADWRGLQVQTGVFVALGIGQLSMAWALRARAGTRRLRERAVEIAVLGALVLQLLGIYLGPLNGLLSTEPWPVADLLLVAGVASLPGVLTRVAGRWPRHQT